MSFFLFKDIYNNIQSIYSVNLKKEFFFIHKTEAEKFVICPTTDNQIANL